jgi:hypothetical protein
MHTKYPNNLMTANITITTSEEQKYYDHNGVIYRDTSWHSWVIIMTSEGPQLKPWLGRILIATMFTAVLRFT